MYFKSFHRKEIKDNVANKGKADKVLKKQNTSDGFTFLLEAWEIREHKIKQLGGLKGNKNGFSPVHSPK